MASGVHGIHHVTVISGDAQENLNFYVGVLGMRLVKKSVNQDAPDVYHLFYADGVGSPGTDLTFFPFPGARPGRIGAGMTVETPFAVPVGSFSYWQARLVEHGVPVGPVETRFGEATLPFVDPHGLRLALVESDDPRQFTPWADSPVPAERQLRGMHTVRLWERSLKATEALLTGRMGFALVAEEDGWRRYAVDGGGSGKYVDIKEMPQERAGLSGAGTVHHVAFRVADTPEEMAVRAEVQAAGMQPTPQIDRFWFNSVYFREPGGVLFELATDGPGFDRDEDMAHLGEQLILPPWLEQYRAQIEAVLPPLTMPRVAPTR
ncbi:MAG: ring-cleaving dioxygenase [Anaerolineae bacterium]